MSQSTIDSMVAALMPGWGGQQCSVDGLLTGCAFAMSLEASGAADRCPDDDCGTHTVTVIAKGADGHVIGSSTVVVTPGQPGWDGSLDGTYSVINSANNPVKFNGSPDAINTFLNAAATAGPSGIGEFTTSYGGVAFQKTLGTPQNLAPLPNRTNNNLINATNALASKLASGVSEDCQKNVIDKLKGIGFDLNRFINFLGNNPQFYNGVTSQALAAGTVSPKQPAHLLYGPEATIADVLNGSGTTR